MDRCPLCGRQVEGQPKECPDCGAPLRDDPAALQAAEQAVLGKRSSRGSFGRFCLVLGMIVSLISALAAPAVGLYLMTRGGEAALVGLIAAPLGLCLNVAQFLVFRKVHELYEFTPPP